MYLPQVGHLLLPPLDFLGVEDDRHVRVRVRTFLTIILCFAAIILLQTYSGICRCIDPRLQYFRRLHLHFVL